MNPLSTTGIDTHALSNRGLKTAPACEQRDGERTRSRQKSPEVAAMLSRGSLSPAMVVMRGSIRYTEIVDLGTGVRSYTNCRRRPMLEEDSTDRRIYRCSHCPKEERLSSEIV